MSSLTDSNTDSLMGDARQFTATPNCSQFIPCAVPPSAHTLRSVCAVLASRSSSLALSPSSLSPTSEFSCLLDYLATRRAHRSLLHHCSLTLTTTPGHTEARFYRSFALIHSHSQTDAIRELDQLNRSEHSNGQYALAATAAILAAYRGVANGAGGKAKVDKESVEKYKDQLKQLSKTSDTPSLLVAGRYFLHAGKDKQAKQCLDKILSKGTNGTAVVYMAMLGVRTGQMRSIKKALLSLDTLISSMRDQKAGVDIGAHLLTAWIYSQRGEYNFAMDYLNAIIVSYPNFTPALIEKSVVLLCVKNYDESVSLSHRILQKEQDNIFALFHVVIYFLLKEGSGGGTGGQNSLSSKERLNDLLFALNKTEAGNSYFYLHFSSIVARLTYNKNKPILTLTLQLLDTVTKQRQKDNLPPSAALLIEQAYQQSLLDEWTAAVGLYTQASRLEESGESGGGSGGGGDEDGGSSGGGSSAQHMGALLGVIRCKVRQSRWKEASEELDFLADLSSSQVLKEGGETDATKLELLYLKAALAGHYERDAAKATQLLIEWSTLHRSIQQAAGSDGSGTGHTHRFADMYNRSYDHLIALQPQLLIDVVQLSLHLLPNEPREKGDPPSQLLSVGLSLLAQLLSSFPGHLQAFVLQAKLQFLSADFTAASASLSAALTLDPTSSAAHLLSAYVSLYQEAYKQCSASLEQSRSYDFEVRNTVQYHWLKARLLVVAGQMDDAMKVLLAAMDLPGVKAPGSGGNGGMTKRGSGKGGEMGLSAAASGGGKGAFPLTDDDRLSVYLELAAVHGALGQLPEATRVMNEAKAQFVTNSGSSAAKSNSTATRLLMAEVELHLQRKEYDGALSLLRSVDSESAYHTRAKVKQADILLVHKRSKKAYVGCYEDLCVLDGSLHHMLLLAEAYARVQEMDAAIAAYERALSMVQQREREEEEAGTGAAAGEVAAVSSSDIYSRIGKAMVATHDYRRAVDYFEEAVRTEEEKDAQRAQRNQPLTLNATQLLLDLVALYVKMKQYDAATQTVQKALEDSRAKRTARLGADTAAATADGQEVYGMDDIPLLQLDVKAHTLLSQVHAACHAHEQLLQTLNTAYALQSQLLALLPSSSSQLTAEKETSSTLCYQLANYYQSHQSNHEQAILYYHESLKANPTSHTSLLALAQLFFSLNEYEQAEQTLLSLLRIQPAHRTATLLLAELMYERNEADAAIYHFTSLLEKDGRRYDALAKMITILKRSGRLSDAGKYIGICEKAVTGSTSSTGQAGASKAPAEGAKSTQPVDSTATVVHHVTAAGLHYCKGLHHYYQNQPRDALLHFNYARKDHEWGKVALEHMINIYINPDHLDLFVETSETTATDEGNKPPKAAGVASGGKKGHSGDDMAGSMAANLASAERLLQELHTMYGNDKPHKLHILESYILLASKNSKKQEKAVERCMDVLNVDNSYVPALLCLANANHLLHQPAKARNYLKRISKMKFNLFYVDEFEQSYLLLAEMYVELGKFEIATELCKKTLHVNKSNGKAWEILGSINEREAAYRDASDNYEQAWYNCGQSNVNIGFKLAYNYLKCKKFVEAIDICHAILKLNPDMPKVRKEILSKARDGLRP